MRRTAAAILAILMAIGLTAASCGHEAPPRQQVHQP